MQICEENEILDTHLIADQEVSYSTPSTHLDRYGRSPSRLSIDASLDEIMHNGFFLLVAEKYDTCI